LSSGLLAIGDDSARDLVGGSGDSLLELLGGSRSSERLKALLGLVAEILTSEVS